MLFLPPIGSFSKPNTEKVVLYIPRNNTKNTKHKYSIKLIIFAFKTHLSLSLPYM